MKNLILLISACMLVVITGCRQDCPNGVCPREMADIVQASPETDECCDTKCKRTVCEDVAGCPFLKAHPNAMKCPFFKNLMAEKCCKCENCECDPCKCCKCENCECDPCKCCKRKDCCKSQKPECKNCEEPYKKDKQACKTKFYHWNALLLRRHRHPCH